MLQTITRKNNIVFVGLLLLILLANTLLYRIPEIYPTSGIILATMIDLMIILPLLTYFFIIRKRYSLKFVGLAILAGYGTATFIIPKELFQHFTIATYFVLFSEGLFILVELYILYKTFTKLPGIWRDVRMLQMKSSYFRLNLQDTIASYLPKNRIALVWVTELSLFYYSLFSWKKKAHSPTGEMFTYHTKTSSTAVYIMLIHATIIETIGLHYFLHQWNEIVSYILLFFNVYSVLYFLAELQAIRLTPFLLTDNTLQLYVGVSKGLSISLRDISEFRRYEGPAKFNKIESKTLFVATVADIDVEPAKPHFEILLKEPRQLHLMFGLSKKVNRVVLNVDNPELFFQSLNQRLDHAN